MKKINPRKQALIELSKRIKIAQKMGGELTGLSVNKAILKIYEKQTGQTEWNTFKGWKNKGFKVQKGQKGFAIWSKPRKVTKKEDEKEEKYKFYGMAYLFHSDQVEAIEELADA